MVPCPIWHQGESRGGSAADEMGLRGKMAGESLPSHRSWANCRRAHNGGLRASTAICRTSRTPRSSHLLIHREIFGHFRFYSSLSPPLRRVMAHGAGQRHQSDSDTKKHKLSVELKARVSWTVRQLGLRMVFERERVVDLTKNVDPCSQGTRARRGQRG